MHRRLRQCRTWFQQRICAYRGHGRLYIGVNHLSMFCGACGWQSSGVELETRRVRSIWMFEKHRLRWKARTRLQKTAC